jgi:hypothetical protein
MANQTLHPPTQTAVSDVGSAQFIKDELKGINEYLRSCKEISCTFDGVHDSTRNSVQEAWKDTLTAVEADCALSQRSSNMARVMFLKAHLSSRPLADYLRLIGQWAAQRTKELQKPIPDQSLCAPLPDYQSICDQLRRDYLAGQRQSLIELTEQIQNCKLHQLAEKYGSNPFPALAQVWQDYKALYRTVSI